MPSDLSEITRVIIAGAIEVRHELGPGPLEHLLVEELVVVDIKSIERLERVVTGFQE